MVAVITVALVVSFVQLFFFVWLVKGFRSLRVLRRDALLHYEAATRLEEDACVAYREAKSFSDDLYEQASRYHC